MPFSLNRRSFVLASTAFAAQFALPHAGRAQQVIKVPTVDALKVKVITDSSYDTPRAGTSKWVKVTRAPFTSQSDFRKTLHNEWGLALALESRIGGDTRNLLLDYGYTTNALLNNMEILGVDSSRVQGLIVSHGHFDHYGGLIGWLQKYRDKLPADLTLYAGGEDNFCVRKAGRGAGNFAEAGVLDRRELAALKVRVVLCQEPTVIAGHAFTTGVIPSRSFERVLPNTFVEYARRDGVGCDIPAAAAKAGGKPVPDEHLNEHATCFNVKERGLVVISSCGHRGIVNSTLQAMEVSGVKKVHAVLGGFHLFPADDEYLRRTVTELKTLSPDVIIPFHCSGPDLVTVLRAELQDKLVTSTTGTEFAFGA
jgi:7,8-dihydropterin-6-yl-methyl-4-(beta-D-ribofuranosyl)aminobenzene 5'-phosphate synthase